MTDGPLSAGRCAPCAWFLVGPTASGKSAVAQYIAEREGRLIVSADSMNVYRGMDIGTAKPTADERRRVAYAGIDLADPSDKFSVAAYLEAVRPAFGSDREAIVVGGTGLYIKCLTEGFDDVPPEDSAFRAGLETLDFESLEKQAKQDAPELYNQLTEDDRRNPRRLVRILEKEAGESATPPTGRRGLRPSKSWNSGPIPTIVGLHVERDELHQRIEQRVEQMYASGLLEEARVLMGLQLSSTALQAIGYAEAFAVLKNEMTVKEAKEKTVIRTRQLAKRQMTWFRNQLKIEWVNVADYADIDALAAAVCCEWKKTGPAPVHI